MRRRRQKNTLLPKMIGLALLINAILLPFLAKIGAFKSFGGKRTLTQVELVKLPPAEKRPPAPKKVPKKVAAKARSAEHKAASRQNTARPPSGLPPVHVVAAGNVPNGSGNGGDSGITGSGPGTDQPPVKPPVTVTPPPPITSPPVPPVPVPIVTPKPPPPAPPSPHIPTLTAAVPLAQPHPEIPEELRDADLNAAFEGVFTVHANGTATVNAVSGTGNAALDSLALDAARRWTFRPATRDGQPVESYLRLRIEFDVGT